MTGDRPPRRVDDRDGPRQRRLGPGGPRRADERGQAFTLEGFIASVVVLSAVLFALQALVFTPTSGGQVDSEVRDKLRTQARDVLSASAHNGTQDLSHQLRYFSNETTGTWVGNSQSLDRGYGETRPLSPKRTVLGAGMNQTFTQRGFSYNVELEYLTEDEANATDTTPMVFRGVPPEEAVSVSYTVVLYDNETLSVPPTSSSCGNKPIEEIIVDDTNNEDFNNSGENCFFPIPEAALFDDDSNTGASRPGNQNECSTASDPACENSEGTDSPIYNVVEVRVVIW